MWIAARSRSWPLTLLPFTSRCTSNTIDDAIAMLISAIRASATVRRGTDRSSRSVRGIDRTSVQSSATASVGIRIRAVVISPLEPGTNRAGIVAYRAAAVSTASTGGRRDSPISSAWISVEPGTRGNPPRTVAERSDGAERARRVLGSDRVEVDARAELPRGDVPHHPRRAPRRDDLDVELRVRPVTPVERALVDPEHVRGLRVEEAVEPPQHVDEQLRQPVATRVVERRQIRHGVVRREDEPVREGRRLGHPRAPPRRL